MQFVAENCYSELQIFYYIDFGMCYLTLLESLDFPYSPPPLKKKKATDDFVCTQLI